MKTGSHLQFFRPFLPISLICLGMMTTVGGSQFLNDGANTTGAEALTDLETYFNRIQQFFNSMLKFLFERMSGKTNMMMDNGVGPSTSDVSAQLDKEGRVTYNVSAAQIPTAFDARTAWPQCGSIGRIRDQSVCGACWAVCAAEVISDRICISSGGRNQYDISAADLLSCCGEECGQGCTGGNPLQAMKFWVSQGVVTGSGYDEQLGCMPYSFPPCEHHNNNTQRAKCSSLPDQTPPTCTKKCQTGYPLTYAQDKHYGKSAYGLSKAVSDIQTEIMVNGPVEAMFDVYEDFEQYSSGVYVHRTGQFISGHAVKVIGWGIEGTTPYWLVVNSWNEDWGERGLFRIIRGTNECSFEEAMVAGLPK